jgi:hypothetical protein
LKCLYQEPVAIRFDARDSQGLEVCIDAFDICPAEFNNSIQARQTI